MNDVIEYYENKGYIFYDLANLTSFYNYFKFIIYNLWNYNKIISYLNYSSIIDNNNNNKTFYKLYIKILLIYINYRYNPYYKNYNKKTIFFFYKGKIFITNKPSINDKKNLLDINNILLNNFYDCNVCFNDKCKQIIICFRCNFQTCYKCKEKLNKISNSCCCCKYTYNS
jgi:hypothetical protein